MKGIKLFTYLILLSPFISHAQEVSIKAQIQPLSSGGLYYEYQKHINTNKKFTIVFESGALNSSSYWNPVIDSISLFANTLRYDRAGLGRSLPSIDTIRSSIQIAKELNELLDSLKINENIILVCHSAGGFYGRTFTQQYSKRIKALVLIESPCTEWEYYLKSSLSRRQNEERDSLLAQNRRELSSFQRNEYLAAEKNRIILDQIPKMRIPVYIIFGDNHQWPQGYDGEKLNRKWKECQESLLDISTDSKLKRVNNAGHHLFQEFNLSQFLQTISAELD